MTLRSIYIACCNLSEHREQVKVTVNEDGNRFTKTLFELVQTEWYEKEVYTFEIINSREMEVWFF